MKHEVTIINSCDASCSCGYSVTGNPGAAEAWREQHLRKFSVDVNGRTWVQMALSQTSDEDLRAECERRFAGPVNEYTRLAAEHDKLKADRDHLHARLGAANQDYADMKSDRDEWKRRAERAESAMRAFDAQNFERLKRDVERGPGIAAKPPPCVDSSHWVDPWEFMEDA